MTPESDIKSDSRELAGRWIDESRRTTVSGIGGEHLVVHVGEIIIELITSGENVRWITHVRFTSYPDPEQEVGILGMLETFDLFPATFDGEKREVELKLTSERRRLQEMTSLNA